MGPASQLVHVYAKGFVGYDVIFYLPTGSAGCSLGLISKSQILFCQSLATHTHRPPSILHRAVEDAEVACWSAVPLTWEGPIHTHSICMPGMLQAL